jgi:hypothetical protein
MGLFALAAAGVSCGDDQEAATNDTAINATVISTPAATGFPAPIPTDDADVSLTLTPASASPGGTVVLAASAESEPWYSGPDAENDAEVGDEWRTLWGVRAEEYGGASWRVDDSPTPSVPAIALTVPVELTITLPTDIEPGAYRVCQHFVSDSDGSQMYVCAPLTISV